MLKYKQYSIERTCTICNEVAIIQSSSKKNVKRICRKCFYENRSKSELYSEILDKNGYVRIKINTNTEKSKWVYKHRYIWESVNGCLKKGYVVHHIDHDRQNNKIENLEMMEKRTHDVLTSKTRSYIDRKYPTEIKKYVHCNQKDFSKDDILKLLQETKSLRKVAQILATTKGTIMRNLKDYNVKYAYNKHTQETTIL